MHGSFDLLGIWAGESNNILSVCNRVDAMQATYTPLSRRSVAQLRDQAERYHHMAATANTAEVRNALLRLAARITALAEQREREATDDASQPG